MINLVTVLLYVFYKLYAVSTFTLKRLIMSSLLLFVANAVLEGACERVIVGDLYCDIPLGLYVIRGENVVLIGELLCVSKILTFTIYIFPHKKVIMRKIYCSVWFLTGQDLEREELPAHMTCVSVAEIRRVSDFS